MNVAHTKQRKSAVEAAVPIRLHSFLKKILECWIWELEV